MQEKILKKETNISFLTNEKFINIMAKNLVIIILCTFILYWAKKTNIEWLGYNYYSIFDGMSLMLLEILSHIDNNGIEIFIRCISRYAFAISTLILGGTSILVGSGIIILMFYKKIKSREYKYCILLIFNILLFGVLTYFYFIQLWLVIIIIGEFVKVLTIVSIIIILGLLMFLFAGGCFF